MKPRPIRVLFPDGTTEQLFFDFALLVYDLVEELNNEVKEVPQDCVLYHRCAKGDGRSEEIEEARRRTRWTYQNFAGFVDILLEYHDTLRDRNLPDFATLVFKKPEPKQGSYTATLK